MLNVPTVLNHLIRQNNEFSFVSPYTDLHGTHATIGILDVDDKLGRIRNEQQEAA